MQRLHKQRGVVLITLVLLVVSSSAFVMLKALNVAATNQNSARIETRAVLTQAKLALLGYTVHRPALNLGPGRLPCPIRSNDTDTDADTDPAPAHENDGQAELACSLGGVATTGRYPYATVGIGELRDASGAKLWLAVAESHRYFLDEAINSDTGDTSDDLAVDGVGDIAAVIIAPGPAIANQDRSAGMLAIHYLEGDNATIDDASFTEVGSGAFNDEIITITRAELMKAAEQRVLGDVKRGLNDYYATYGGYPWASVFSDPATKTVYSPSVGLREGHLAVHQDGESITANFTLGWDITSGSLSAVSPSSAPGPQDACMRSNQCIDDDVDIAYDFTGLTIVGDTCTWTNAEAFDCTAQTTVDTPAHGELVRTVSIRLNGISPTIVPPTATSGRTRGFVLDGRMPADSSGEIEVSDTLAGADRGSRILSLAESDLVNIRLQGIPFLIGDDFDIVSNPASSPGALPRWFTKNNWHHFVYHAFSSADELATLGDCRPLVTPCLTLEVTRLGGIAAANNKIRALAVIAGRSLTGLPRGGLMSDYFEAENDQTALLDGVFLSSPPNSTFNDQVTIVCSGNSTTPSCECDGKSNLDDRC